MADADAGAAAPVLKGDPLARELKARVFREVYGVTLVAAWAPDDLKAAYEAFRETLTARLAEAGLGKAVGRGVEAKGWGG